MVYKLIVNAAFLAIGYYIGKEVCRSETIRKELTRPIKSATESAAKPSAQDSTKPSP